MEKMALLTTNGSAGTVTQKCLHTKKPSFTDMVIELILQIQCGFRGWNWLFAVSETTVFYRTAPVNTKALGKSVVVTKRTAEQNI